MKKHLWKKTSTSPKGEKTMRRTWCCKKCGASKFRVTQGGGSEVAKGTIERGCSKEECS